MLNQTLCIIYQNDSEHTDQEAMRLIRQSGFDGIFTGYQNIKNYAELAKEQGLIYQSVHGPYYRARDIWHSEGDSGEVGVNELIATLRDCADNNVPIMVTHPYIGFTFYTPTQMGLDRFGRVVSEAVRLGVILAIENSEGNDYMATLFKEFKNNANVGFCWDSGHEICYNHPLDLLSMYGDRLVMTHISDNLGIKDPKGQITPMDDLHLLPFDGIIDWKRNMERLKKCSFSGTLTFELNRRQKTDRHETDKYFKMSLEEYFAECYCRACRVAAMYGDKT